MGNLPKPTKLRQLQNNPGRRKLNQDEPKFRSGIPACPKWLTVDAKQEWRRVTRELSTLGMLTKVDMAALAAYCQQFARWKQAEQHIAEHGLILAEQIHSRAGVLLSIRYRRNPASVVASDALKHIRAFAALFGFDPSSRARLHVNPANGVDPLDEFLNEDPEDDGDASTAVH